MWLSAWPAQSVQSLACLKTGCLSMMVTESQYSRTALDWLSAVPTDSCCFAASELMVLLLLANHLTSSVDNFVDHGLGYRRTMQSVSWH